MQLLDDNGHTFLFSYLFNHPVGLLDETLQFVVFPVVEVFLEFLPLALKIGILRHKLLLFGIALVFRHLARVPLKLVDGLFHRCWLASAIDAHDRKIPA